MHHTVKIRRFLPAVLVSVLALGMLLSMRPLPSAKASVSQLTQTEAKKVSIPWPVYGQASIGAEGFGVLESRGEIRSMPMASITKLVTALTVLNKKPLKAGEQGPALVMSEKDVALYPSYLSRNGSVVPVAAGQRISQYKVMQAMLIPSANNMADSLAVWAFGSMENYVKEANAYLKSVGLEMTSVADASGFSPQSVSTSDDLVRLGIIAMENPIVAEIVSQEQADLPLAGTIYSTNRLLGVSGVIGIKTGNTEEAGGCYLFAAKHSVQGQEILIVGAVLNAPTLSKAISDSRRMLEASKPGFEKVKAVSKNQLVSRYLSPWGKEASVIASKDVEVVTWQADNPKINLELRELKNPQKAGTKVGKVVVSAGGNSLEADAVLADDLEPPSAAWRIFH